MIIGNKSIFAVESCITQAYERLCFRGLGYFVLHIGGTCYGVRDPEATMLACAFDEVRRIIAAKGKHTAAFASEQSAENIVDAIYQVVYTETLPEQKFFGIPAEQFREMFYSSRSGWHYRCDEAFDDGSFVYHFDIGSRVRLIAGRPSDRMPGALIDPATLRDVWLESEQFYGVLQGWSTSFEAEWSKANKISKLEDGAEIA